MVSPPSLKLRRMKVVSPPSLKLRRMKVVSVWKIIVIENGEEVVGKDDLLFY